MIFLGNNTVKTTLRFAGIYPGIGVTIFLGLASIIFTLIAQLRLPIWLILIFILLTLVASVYLSALIAKKTCPPETYSKLLISGTNVTEVLEHIAIESRKLHYDFVKRTANSVFILERVYENRAYAEKHKIKEVQVLLKKIWKDQNALQVFKTDVEAINEFLLVNHERFERVDKLINEASNELNIPTKRFMNHIIQFTPKLYLNRITKYRNNLVELLSGIDVDFVSRRGVNAEAILVRIFGLAKQNRKIIKICKQRISRAHDIIKYNNISPYVCELASCSSTTASLLIYTSLLSKISNYSLQELSKWNGNISDQNYVRITRMFQYVFRKQKAYPGFDPHELLISLFNYHKLEKPEDFVGTKVEILDTLQNFKSFFKVSKKERECFFIPKEEFEKLTNITKDKEYEIKIMSILESLSTVDLISKDLITTYKQRLVEKVKENYFSNFFKNTTGRKYIVTHGYSKTIRQIIKHSLKKEDKNKNYIFILETDLSSKFQSQLMKFELQNETSSSDQYFDNICIGDVEILRELVDKENDKIMILMGAECFDKYGRVVIGKGFKKVFETLKNYFNHNNLNYISIVASEAYKGGMESISNSEPFDDHFDRVEIISGNKFNFLITENSQNNIATADNKVQNGHSR